jgi:hypothetical protein
MTSASFITGTGLKKCIPIIFAGRRVTAASRVIEIEDFRLDFKFLGGGLDDEVAGRKVATLEHGLDALQRRGFVASGNFAFGQFAIEVLADGFEAAIKESLFHIAQRHPISAAREHLRNAIAHGSRADHSHPFDWHKYRFSFALVRP